MSRLLNVFVQIAKCICPNYKFSHYLFWICFLLFRSFWMRNVCPKFSIFVDAISQCNAIFTAIFSFCFDSHSFRKSPRSDTLIQRTKNTYTWQMTQVPLKGKKCSHQLHTITISNVQTINWCLTFSKGASSPFLAPGKLVPIHPRLTCFLFDPV